MLTKVLFHGSDKRLISLKPVGVNMGHRWAKPEWAIFFWGDYVKAQKWAVYQLCRRTTDIKLMYHIPSGGFAITAEQLRQLSRLVKGKRTYVYQATLPLTQIGLGSSPDIEEYTYTKEVVPEKTTELVLTQDLLSQTAVLMSESEYASYRADVINGKYAGGRGFIYRLIMDSERDQLRHKYHKKIKDGSLKPGDDLENVSLEHLPPAFRW